MNVKDKEYEDRTKEERRLRMEAKNEAIRKEDMIPATYKFGASKSRMVLLVIVAILPTVGTLIMKKTGIKLSTIALTPQTIVMLCLGGILVIEFVSFMLSIKIRKKRE